MSKLCQYGRIDIYEDLGDDQCMRREIKTEQLQIRVSSADKASIQRNAKQADMDMSEYVLSRLLSGPANEFQQCAAAATDPGTQSFALAELNSLLCMWTPSEIRNAVAQAPSIALSPFLENYIAAMVEYACARRAVPAPAWTCAVRPLDEPFFGTTLQSLRLHLLTHSPPPFRRRNIFIDSSLGARV